jgi:hypothetical protein
MRVMEIPPFPRTIEIPDLENLLRTRLSTTVVMWPDQAIPLLGCMCHPNDAAARDALVRTLWSWANASDDVPPVAPDELRRIQANWLRVADIFHVYCDLIEGRHQERRGGPSIGKAITLVAATTKSWGTSPASLWKLWRIYKDVAHLVTAATLIRAEGRKRSRGRSLGPSGLSVTQILPFQMTLLMPDLVLAVAMEFERYGLDIVSNTRPESALDPETLWRVPADINVSPFPVPIRKLRQQDVIVLNNRRAGNRGLAGRGLNNAEPWYQILGTKQPSTSARNWLNSAKNEPHLTSKASWLWSATRRRRQLGATLRLRSCISITRAFAASCKTSTLRAKKIRHSSMPAWAWVMISSNPSRRVSLTGYAQT